LNKRYTYVPVRGVPHTLPDAVVVGEVLVLGGDVVQSLDGRVDGCTQNLVILVPTLVTTLRAEEYNIK